MEVAMKHLGRLGAAMLVLVLSGTARGKPDREAPEVAKPAISVANAAQVIKMEDIARDVQKIAWIARKRQLALLSWEMPIEVLDGGTLKPAGLIAATKKPINFAITQDGDTAGWCENNAKAEIQDLRSGKGFTVETNNPQPRVAFSPNGKLFATGGYGTQAKVWKTGSGELVHILACPIGPRLKQPVEGGLTVVFSPNGEMLPVGNRNSITGIYDVQSGKSRLHFLVFPVSPVVQLLA
jgi:WD40 repeat protein